MDERSSQQAIAGAVPGRILHKDLAGAHGVPVAYAVIVSELDGEYFTSFLEFYDPQASEGPRPQCDVPPVPDGVAVTYREQFANPIEAGEQFGFFSALLMEEGRLGEEGFKPGLDYLRSVVAAHQGGVLAERLYESGLDEDPDYAAEIERQLEERVPDAGAREALKSLSQMAGGEERRGHNDHQGD